MSGACYGEPFPSWEQLLSGVRTAPGRQTRTHPRHARTWVESPFAGDTMSWGEAAAWSVVALSLALVVGRWAAQC